MENWFLLNERKHSEDHMVPQLIESIVSLNPGKLLESFATPKKIYINNDGKISWSKRRTVSSRRFQANTLSRFEQYEKKRNQRMIQQKKIKMQTEMIEHTNTPRINKSKSRSKCKGIGRDSRDSIIHRVDNIIEDREQKVQRKRTNVMSKIEEEMKEWTFSPLILSKSQVNRTVEDLFEWQKQKKIRQMEKSITIDPNRLEWTFKPEICGNSRILVKKRGLRKDILKVEDRLLKHAKPVVIKNNAEEGWSETTIFLQEKEKRRKKKKTKSISKKNNEKLGLDNEKKLTLKSIQDDQSQKEKEWEKSINIADKMNDEYDIEDWEFQLRSQYKSFGITKSNDDQIINLTFNKWNKENEMSNNIISNKSLVPLIKKNACVSKNDPFQQAQPNQSNVPKKKELSKLASNIREELEKTRLNEKKNKNKNIASDSIKMKKDQRSSYSRLRKDLSKSVRRTPSSKSVILNWRHDTKSYSDLNGLCDDIPIRATKSIMSSYGASKKENINRNEKQNNLKKEALIIPVTPKNLPEEVPKSLHPSMKSPLFKHSNRSGKSFVEASDIQKVIEGGSTPSMLTQLNKLNQNLRRMNETEMVLKDQEPEGDSRSTGDQSHCKVAVKNEIIYKNVFLNDFYRQSKLDEADEKFNNYQKLQNTKGSHNTNNPDKQNRFIELLENFTLLATSSQ